MSHMKNATQRRHMLLCAMILLIPAMTLIASDCRRSTYHLKRDRTEMEASVQPQIYRAAAKASAHDNLQGLPAVCGSNGTRVLPVTA